MEVNIQKLKTQVPDYVYKVAGVLAENNFQAYLVGGAVRDLIMGKEPKDYDIATNALPDQMMAIFPHCITTNARFGTVLVIMDSETSERFDVEVTTFREEAEYFGGRWPGKVDFTSDIEVDLSRRDFTINAMALDLIKLRDSADQDDLNSLLLDPFKGLNDIDNKIIRAVGNPVDRFTEDGLRSFRACRLASVFEYKIDEPTFEAIKQTLPVAGQISMERIRDEFVKCVKNSPRPSVGIELMRRSGLLEIFMPELLGNIGVTQPEFHEDDVYTHSLKVMDMAEDPVKIAGLLHDIGKKDTRMIGPDGKTHFFGHDVKSAELAKNILARIKFSNAEIKRISSLIRWHMFYYPSAEWRKHNNINEIMEGADKNNEGGWSDGAIRRFINRVGEDLIDDLFRLRIADANANPRSEFHPDEIIALQKRISEIKTEDMALKLKDLKINGEDLKDLGVTPGPQIGKILNKLLNLVLDQPLLNTKEQLMELAKRELVKSE